MVRALTIALAAFGVAISAHAGTSGKLTGQVTDQDGQPLPGVAVWISDVRKGATTDGKGIYLIKSVDPGLVTLRASMIGYRPAIRRDVVVVADLTTHVSFVLRERDL